MPNFYLFGGCYAGNMENMMMFGIGFRGTDDFQTHAWQVVWETQWHVYPEHLGMVYVIYKNR